eukprot:Gregarina_sp_Poly_1__6308@NODE_3356_length_1155_cov_58_693015_g2124_i0_p1_GENE_NODE_3356_length_1155_cov_58_693015_g2124_i0NODE_3356_length_1155_cov_58_693015_g2124_i0_p1_ORF_typecomplete_len259_score19_20Asp_Glu_race/PF01177_22/7_4e38_NODE_3356_length_1155_cov_58_693015_g2124_i03121088
MKQFFAVIGGMGTISTESYLRLINHRIKITKDQDYLDYVLFNHATIPDRTSYILDHSNPSFLPHLLEDIRMSNLLNPAFIVIICNTAHYFYKELKEASAAPLLHMPRIAINRMAHVFSHENRIGLIATAGTIADGIYKTEIERVGRTVVLGGPEIQPLVTKLIYENIKSKGTTDKKLYHHILSLMHNKYKVNVIVLGCTELSLAQESAPDHPYNVIDAQSIIADVSIELAMAIRHGLDESSVLKPYLQCSFAEVDNVF